jgi:putative redox protein
MSRERDLNTVMVEHVAGDMFTLDIGDHRLTLDQPVTDGGTDAGPTPTELFVAGLAGCVAYYARRYLARHGLPEQGIRIRADWTMTTRPVRVAQIRIALDLPDSLPAERREALLAVAAHCTVENSLRTPPEVTITLTAAPTTSLR